jgi:hypothetical protein
MFFRGKRGGPKERRRSVRIEGPALAAFYWTGGVSTPCRVGNICRRGAYIKTDQEWYAGTILHLILEPQIQAGVDDAKVRAYLQEQFGTGISGGFAPSPPSPEGTRTFGLWARIVHTHSGGMGMEFILTDRQEEREFDRFLEAALKGSGVNLLAKSSRS